MTLNRRLLTLLAGLVAGLVATASLALFMIAGRYFLGVTPPPEAIPDRVAPLLSIHTFFGLFGDYGGYNGLKKFGIRSGTTGVIVAGLVAGLVYPLIAESVRSRRAGTGRFGIPKHGLAFILAATLVLWVASVIFLWPVLVTNFKGLPPFDARLVTMGWYLLTYVVGFGVVLLLAYRLITERVGLARIAPAPVTPFVGHDIEMVTARMDAGADSGAAVALPASRPAMARHPLPVARPVARRSLLAVILAAILVLPSWALFRRLYGMAAFAYDGRPYNGSGIQPITPNAEFYSVTKNVVDPRIDTGIWRLDVFGMVTYPRSYSYEDLLQLSPYEQESTLMCISNRVGSGLFSNALWDGVQLRTILNEAGVKEGAVEVKLYGADGYIDTFAIDKALDSTTMLAHTMNGEPLPQKHGGPVRLLVPGLFGEKNIKWITGIEVVDYDAKGFYEQQGWGPNFAPYTRSDFYSPQVVGNNRFRDSFRTGETVTVKGRAFAGDRGVQSIEFSPDDGQTWQPVSVTYPGTDLTWVFWEADWQVPNQPGDYVVSSRAVDGNGDPQIPEAQDTVPQGAHGYHRVTATVE